MNNYWAFAPMTASNDLLGDDEALRRRMDEEGYLYFRGLLPADRIAELRERMLALLAEHGWIAAGKQRDEARAVSPPWREGDEEYFEVYDEVQRLEAFHTLAHDERLMTAMRAALGETAFPHPLKVARLVFPSNPLVTTPPHQDFLNNQGTPSLTAAWIPLGDCSMNQGTLAILRGSNRFGVLPLAFHMGPGNRQAVVPPGDARGADLGDAPTWGRGTCCCSALSPSMQRFTTQRRICACRSTFATSVRGRT